MGLVTAKLEETATHVVALSILLLNLRKIQHAFLQFLDWLLGFLQPCENWGLVSRHYLRACFVLPVVLLGGSVLNVVFWGQSLGIHC